MRRFLAYSYRSLSDSDLKHMLSFLESPAGKRYVTAYNASMGAGFDAMGKRTGEQLGESLRELAQAHLDTPAESRAPPGDCALPNRLRPRLTRAPRARRESPAAGRRSLRSGLPGGDPN